MGRSLPLKCALLALACGPSIGAPSNDADGSGGSTAATPDDAETSFGTGADASVSDAGDDAESTGSTTAGPDTREPIECGAEGAQPVSIGRFELEPVDREFDPLPPSISGTTECTVTEAIEDDADPFVRMQLSCATEDGPMLLEWNVDAELPLVDTSWVGHALTLTADASWGVWFAGWWVLRDEQGELLVAEGASLPPPEASAPFAISVIDLGEACPSDLDAECHEVFEHRVRFTSDEGTFDCYDDLGHETAKYVLSGSAASWEMIAPYWECKKYDAPSGLDEHFRIMRRP
jgi:hypothetical protein